MVDNAAMVYEHLFLQAHEGQDVKGGGGVNEIPRVTHEDRDGEG